MPDFTVKRKFLAHDMPINAIAISNDGYTMLTGGDDGFLMVWNLETGEKLQEISCVFHGQVIAIRWIDNGKGDKLVFAFGCADGNLQVYQRSDPKSKFTFCSMTSAHSGPVQDITFDRNHGRIASAGGGTVKVWQLNAGGSLENITMDVPEEELVAASVHFCDIGASVVVCFCESHEILCYNIKPYSLKWARQIPTRIGHSALSSDEQWFFVSNLVSGVDQYRFQSMERLRSFSYPILRNYVMHVSIIGSQVAVGGDDGFARLFDIKTGRLVQILEHSLDTTLIQTVSTHEGERCFVIATATTGDGASEVKLWSRRSLIKDGDPEKIPVSTTSWLQLLMVAFMTAAFVSIITSEDHYKIALWVRTLLAGM